MVRSGQASASDSETGPSPETRTPRSDILNTAAVPFLGMQGGRTTYSREDLYKQRESAVRPNLNEELSGTGVYEEEMTGGDEPPPGMATLHQPKRRDGTRPQQLRMNSNEVQQIKDVTQIVEEAEGGRPLEIMDDMPVLLESSAERPHEGEPPPLYDAEDSLDDLPALQEASPPRRADDGLSESDRALKQLFDRTEPGQRHALLQTLQNMLNTGALSSQPQSQEAAFPLGGGGGPPRRLSQDQQPHIPVAHPLQLPEAMPLAGALNPNASSFQPGTRGEFTDPTAAPNSQLSMLVEQIQAGRQLEDLMMRGFPQRNVRQPSFGAPPMVSPNQSFGAPRGMTSGNNSQQNSPLHQPFFPPSQNSPISGPALSPHCMMPGLGLDRKQNPHSFLTPVPHGPRRHDPSWSPSQVSATGYPHSTRSAPVMHGSNGGPIPGAPIKPVRTPVAGAPMIGQPNLGRQAYGARVRLEDRFSAMEAPSEASYPSHFMQDPVRLPVPWQSSGSGPVLPPRPPGMDTSQVEDCEHRLKQRQKQIEFGMATQGYLNWVRAKERGINLQGRNEPHIPNIYQKCSKRSWDGQVRLWRQHLHAFDDLTAILWTAQEQDEIKRKLLEDEQRRQMLKERNSQIAVARDALSCGHTVSTSDGSCPGLAL